MALSADVMNPRQEGDFLDIPVADNVLIYEGALVMIDANGYATPLTGTGQKFAGVAYRQADNTIVGHTAGGIRVKVDASNHRRKMAVTGAAQNMLGVPVFASADGTLTMTPATANQRVGVFVDYISTGIGVVLLTPFAYLGLAATDLATLLASLKAAGIINTP
jgi:hypothetical protein